MREAAADGPLTDVHEQGEVVRKAREAKEQADDDLRAVLASPPGRRLVWRLVNTVAGAFGLSFGGDSHLTAYHEGRRAVGLSLMVDAQRVAPREWVLALTEALASHEARTPSARDERLAE